MAGLKDLTAEQKQIADDNNINRKTLGSRLRKGWSIEEAITTQTNTTYSRKAKKGGRQFYGNFVTDNQVDTAEENGVNAATLSERFKNGWSVERAINTPVRSKKRGSLKPGEIKDSELFKIVGRIKYMRMQEKDFPLPIPKPLLIKLERTGKSIDDIPAVKC